MVSLTRQRYLLIIASVAVAACASPCKDQSFADCAESSECVLVTASKIVDDCATPPTAAGCMDRMPACDLALVVAEDPSGAKWQFSDLRVPEGYTNPQSDPIYTRCE